MEGAPRAPAASAHLWSAQVGAAGEKTSNGVATSVISHTSRTPANGAHTNGAPRSRGPSPARPGTRGNGLCFAGVAEAPDDERDDGCDVDMSPPHEPDRAPAPPHAHEPHANGSHQGTARATALAAPGPRLGNGWPRRAVTAQTSCKCSKAISIPDVQ